MDDELRQAIQENRPVKVRPLARAASRPPNSFYKAIERGEIQSIKVGRSIRVPAAEARRLLGIEDQAAA